MKVLMTGSTGFVGTPLVSRLIQDGHDVRVAVRTDAKVSASPSALPVIVGELSAETDWSSAVKGIETVVHLAARAHLMHDPAADPLAAYRRVNVAASLSLARAAAAAGARRLVYISSIKVYGDESAPGRPLRPDSPTCPLDPYGISKLEAEEGLRNICSAGGVELVIVRPPLVYGPGVRANFRQLMSLVARRLPLPLGGIQNQRSMVAVDNLVDLISICVTHPLASGQVLLVSDGEDLSTPEIVRRLAHAMDVRARLLPIPPSLLSLAGRLLGRSAAVHRLCSSLQVDCSETKLTLGWKPPMTVDQGFSRTVAHFLIEHCSRSS